MCGRSPECNSLPEPAGPTDEQFVYELTEAGLKLLAEQGAAAGAPQERERRRRAVGARRPGTVSALHRGADVAPVPYLRIAGEWLRQVGFDIGREYEVAVASGQLTIRLQA